MPKRYAVDVCDEEVGALEEMLNPLASRGGRVISVIFQPAREGSNRLGKFKSEGDFVAVAEFDDGEPSSAGG